MSKPNNLHLFRSLLSRCCPTKRAPLVAALAMVLSAMLALPMPALAATGATTTPSQTTSPDATAPVHTPELKDIFNARYYADANPDVKAVYGYDEAKLYWHCLNYGVSEGRVISPILNLRAYRIGNLDLREAFGYDWQAYLKHFLEYGMKEVLAGRRSNVGILFNPTVYAAAYEDVRTLCGNDIWAIIRHYVTIGMAEGRTIGVITPGPNDLGWIQLTQSARPSIGIAPTPDKPQPDVGQTPSDDSNNGNTPSGGDSGTTTPPAPAPEEPPVVNPDEPGTQTPVNPNPDKPSEETPVNPNPDKPGTQTPVNPNPENPAPSSPETPVTPEAPKAPAEVAIAPEVKDESGTATTTIGADATAIKAIEDALAAAAEKTENKDKVLSITVDTTKDAGGATALAATLSADVISALNAQATALDRPIAVTVKSAVGDVVIPLEAIQSAQGKSGKDVVLAVQNVDKATLPKDGDVVKDKDGKTVDVANAVVVGVDLKVGDAAVTVKDLTDKIQVTVAAPEKATSGKVSVYFVNTDIEKPALEFVIDADVDKDTGRIAFEVNHLTNFVLTEKPKQSEPTTPTPENPDDSNKPGTESPTTPDEPNNPGTTNPDDKKDPEQPTTPVTPSNPDDTKDPTTPPSTDNKEEETVPDETNNDTNTEESTTPPETVTPSTTEETTTPVTPDKGNESTPPDTTEVDEGTTTVTGETSTTAA